MAPKRARTVGDSSDEDEYESPGWNEEVDNGSGDEVEEESAMSDEEARDEDPDEEEEDGNDDEEEEDEEDIGEAASNINDDDDDEDNDDDDLDEGDSGDSSRRMTARQRNKRDGTSANIGLIDLAEIEGTNRPKKVQLSAEEQRIKRAEMARRRRNLSQQRLEEEKKETLDKLLKKRAKKVRGGADEEGPETPKISRSRLHPKHPAFLTWTSTRDQTVLSMTKDRAIKDNLMK